MATYRISEKEVAKAHKAEAAQARKAIRRGITRAAHRGKAHMVKAVDRKDKVYLGQLRNSFHVAQQPGGITLLYNDAPHAGVVELGARPHPVSEEGQMAIREWVRKKVLGISEDLAEQNEEVDAIARAIVERIRRYGQAPTYLFRDEMETLARFLREEVERAKKDLESGGKK